MHELPTCFGADKPASVLRLLKSLYGLRKTARVWHKNIAAGLLQPRVCAEIDNLIRSLSTQYIFTDANDLKTYLGVAVNRLENGAIKLRQTSYINKFLAFNMRPDIAYATFLAARFMTSTRPEHFRLAYRIGHYLLETCTRGMLICPQAEDPVFEVYADADFAGAFHTAAEHTDTIAELALSHTGYLICFCTTPLLSF
eukprot:IDg11606t1